MTVGILDQLTADQRANATTIVAEVKRLGGTQRDAEAALTAAVDESGIRVLANTNFADSLALPHVGVGSDHTSVGIFQQQIGWGGLSTAQRMDPAASADAFITRLLGTPNRAGMSVPMLVQSVQQSGTPDGSNYAAAAGAGTAYADALWTGTNPGTGPTGTNAAGLHIPGTPWDLPTPSLPGASELGQAIGDGLGSAFSALAKPLVGFFERGALIVFGGVAILVGIVMLAHSQGATAPSTGGSSGGSTPPSGGSGGRGATGASGAPARAPRAPTAPAPANPGGGRHRADGTGATGKTGAAGKAGKSAARKSAGAEAADAAGDVAVAL